MANIYIAYGPTVATGLTVTATLSSVNHNAVSFAMTPVANRGYELLDGTMAAAALPADTYAVNITDSSGNQLGSGMFAWNGTTEIVPQAPASGPYVATIVVQDNLGNPLQNILVSLVDGSITYGGALTDSGGHVTFNRPNGTYAVHAYSALYGSANGSVTVNGANVTASPIVMAPIAQPAGLPVPSYVAAS